MPAGVAVVVKVLQFNNSITLIIIPGQRKLSRFLLYLTHNQNLIRCIDAAFRYDNQFLPSIAATKKVAKWRRGAVSSCTTSSANYHQNFF